MVKADVLGVKVDDVTMDEALDMVKNWLDEKGKHYIVTPNPEIIITAQKDEGYKNILNNADLSIPDGVGLKLSGIKHTVYGVDLMEKLVALGKDYGLTIGLLGSKDGVAKKCAECLRKKYPKVRIVYAESGGEVDKEGNSIEYNVESIEGKNQKKANSHYILYSIPNTDILFVAFGPPKQEKWIAKNLDKIPVKIAMGVGGAFDFISGSVPRAPRLVRYLGFEWLFRLLVQPWRIKRQIALIKYLLMIL